MPLPGGNGIGCLTLLFNALNGENGVLYCEADVESGEVQPVNPSWLSLIGGPGIMRKNAHSGCLLVGRQLFQELLGELYVQKKIAYPVCEAAGSLGAAVGIGNLCSIHLPR